MWKGFKYENTPYMVQLKCEANFYYVYLTDLQKLWGCRYSENSLLQDFQENNPLLDVKIDEAIKQVTELINNIDSLEELSMTRTGDCLKLAVKSVKPKVTITFVFELEKNDSDALCDLLTVPLLQTVKHLEEKQKMLCNLIKKKDRELEEYKLEKGLISREDLITETFNEDIIGPTNKELLISSFGKSFWESLAAKHAVTEPKIEEIYQDPWNHSKNKRKVYSAKTAIKKGRGINYGGASST